MHRSWIAVLVAAAFLSVPALIGLGRADAQSGDTPAPAVQPAPTAVPSAPSAAPPTQPVGGDPPAPAAVPAPPTPSAATPTSAPVPSDPPPAASQAPAGLPTAQPSPANATPPSAVPAVAPATRPAAGLPATVVDLHEAEGILGKSVVSATGEDMGRIVDVVVSGDGHMRAAVIDFGGFLGVGSRKVAVDWNALNFGSDGKVGQLTLSMTRNQLRLTPEYKSGEPIVIMGSVPPAPVASAAPTNAAAPASAIPAPVPAAVASPVVAPAAPAPAGVTPAPAK